MPERSVELLHIDCMEYMATQPDKSFDLAIVDPPYGIMADKAQNAAAEQRINAKPGSKAGRGWKKYKNTDWDNNAPTEKYFSELRRVSKNQIIWGGNYMTDNLAPSMGWIVWNKMQRDFSLADGELAWTSYKRALRIFDMSRGEAITNNKVRFHPTQKPVKLYEWLLLNYAEKVYRILDTHLGSGSSAIAAHYFGCDFVGCEIDEDYFQAAKARFEKETRQIAMFDWEPKCVASNCST